MHVIVAGGSAGALDPLRTFVRSLPTDLSAALFVVVHVPATAPSGLARLLGRAGPLPARAASDHAPLEVGTITVGVPDRHLLVERQHVQLGRGPRENGHRPALDPLFRSAADAHGRQVTAVVLSGALDDGTVGAGAVRRHGGRVFVQDPDEATYRDMPDNVRQAVEDARSLPAEDLAHAVVSGLADHTP